VLDLEDGAALPEVKVDAAHDQLEIAIERAAAPKPEPVAAAQPAPIEVKEKVEIPPPPAQNTKPQPAVKLETALGTEPPKASKPEPAKIEAPKAEAPKPEPVAKAELPSAVTDLRFEPKDGFMRLSLEVSKDVEIVKDRSSARGAPVLRLNGTRLPESLVRTLDTSQVAGNVVSAISSYNEGNDAVLAANVGPDT
jgi:hypothetical protein